MQPASRSALSDAALTWAQRIVWLVCIGVYLTVFIGGVRTGGDELLTMGRAIGLTLVAGVLGHTALGVLSRATLRTEQGPTADQAGQVGSLADLGSSTNVVQQEDEAAPA